MAREGYQIFDSDTHVGPAAEILARYLTTQEQAGLASWEPYKSVQKLRIGTLEAGHSWLPFWMARLDEHAHSIAAALPPLKHNWVNAVKFYARYGHA